MKKFSFSLQPVLKIKTLLKKQKKAELSEAASALRGLIAQKSAVEESREKNGREFETSLLGGTNALRMAWFHDYSEYLKDSIAQMDALISAAQSRMDRVQTELTAVSRETDTLERLEQEQYRAYLAEAAKEEEKTLDEIMSYKCAVPQGGLLSETA